MKTGRQLNHIQGQALHLRMIQGLTLRAIGEKLKRSPANIRVAVWVAIRICERKASGNPLDALSTRSRCVLQNVGIWDAETLIAKLADGYDLSRLRNLGEKSIREIHECVNFPLPVKGLPRVVQRVAYEPEPRPYLVENVNWLNPHLPRCL